MPAKPKAPRKSKLAAKCEQAIQAHAALLLILDELTAIPSEPCGPCGRTTEHGRCNRCGACEPSEGPRTKLWANYVPYIRSGCGECGAKANAYSSPVYTWSPKVPFAVTFASDLAAKIRSRGYTPSEKQVALANKLHAESRIKRGKMTSGERPAITWMTFRGRKGWNCLYALVCERSFCLLPYALNCLDADSHHVSRPEEKTVAREALALVRAEVMRIVSEATGYDVLSTSAEYADAMRVVAPSGGKKGEPERGDKLVYNALSAMLETHTWLLREKRVVESEGS